jgi:hypothetical protein
MSKNATGSSMPGRGDKLIKEHEHDPYMMRFKPTSPALCPKCKAVFAEGRWQWDATPPENPNESLCPSCRRIKDKVPAGFLTLSGSFFEANREEIMNLVRNKEENEKGLHPLRRLMDIEESAEGTVITFTDTHLPRGAGTAIESAYEGTLDIHYTEEAGIVRVTWKR